MGEWWKGYLTRDDYYDESSVAAEVIREHRFYRILLRLIDEHPYEDKVHQLHASLVVKSGSILGTGVNSPFLSAFSSKYATHDGFQTHSEFSAITVARKKHDLKGCTVYNARMNRAKQLRLSRPCPACSKMLVNYGITKVVYTTNEGIEVLKQREFD